MSIATTLAPTADDALERAVAARVGSLQGGAIRGTAPTAARLARLRRALTADPGSDPDVWADTIGVLPAELLGRHDEPSQAEQAVHAAMTLYALHQQAQANPMHVPGQSLGRAVQRLRRMTGEDQEPDAGPVLRRFHVLATATSFGETLHHLRGLVTVLRGEHLGLDYGRLAVDLRRLQSPQAAPAVRLRWGRDLYRSAAKPATTTEAPTATSPTVTSPTADQGEDS